MAENDGFEAIWKRFETICRAGAVLGITDLSLDGLFHYMVEHLRPNPSEELATVWQIFAETVPLTIVVTILVAGLKNQWGINAFFVIIVCGAIATWYHLGRGTDSVLFRSPVEWIEFWWTGYGWFLFTKSCVLGGVIGWNFF